HRGLTENLKTLRAEHDKVSQRVNAAFAKFELSPVAEKDGGRLNYVPPGASTNATLEAIVTRRAEAIEKSSAGAVISIQSHSKLINWDTGSVELPKLLNFINASRTGSVFASMLTADAVCKAEVDAQKVLDAVVATVNGEKPDNTLDENQNDNAAKVDKL